MAQENQPDPVDPFPIRRLAAGDNAKGFTALLSQLSSCPPIPDPDFLSLLSSLPADHLVCVAEDPSSSRVVATGSCFVERKFLRGCGKVGHIEDVVVDSSVRGKKLGQKVVEYLTEHARNEGCYKVILDCAPENRGFYEKCGFVEKSVQMAIYF